MDRQQVILTRAVAEASSVAREDARALGQFRGQSKAGPYRLARRRETREGKAPAEPVKDFETLTIAIY